MKWLKVGTNKRGQGLVQALVGVAISGIIGLAVISMIRDQYIEISAVTQKLARSEVTAQLISLLSNEATCTYMMAHFSSNTFDGKSVATSLPKVPITKILSGTNPKAPVVIELKQPVSAMTNKVISDEIYAQIKAGSGNQYYGALVVNFEQGKLTRPMKNIEIPLSFSMDPTSPTSNKKISGCVIGTTGGSELTAKAYFSWNGTSAEANNVSVAPRSGQLEVTFLSPMTNNRYSVMCNGSMKDEPGTEMQIFAFNKTTSSFLVAGSHGPGSDPITFVDCVVYGK